MRGGDSDRNPGAGPLKTVERRWDPSEGSRHLPHPAQGEGPDLLPSLPLTSGKDPHWLNSTRARGHQGPAMIKQVDGSGVCACRDKGRRPLPTALRA